jgi:hypothetical protein
MVVWQVQKPWLKQNQPYRTFAQMMGGRAVLFGVTGR